MLTAGCNWKAASRIRMAHQRPDKIQCYQLRLAATPIIVGQQWNKCQRVHILSYLVLKYNRSVLRVKIYTEINSNVKVKFQLFPYITPCNGTEGVTLKLLVFSSSK